MPWWPEDDWRRRWDGEDCGLCADAHLPTNPFGELIVAIPTARKGLVRLELLKSESSAGGRERFERLVTAIVREVHPTARAVRANPGDWGTDTFKGELSAGR